MPKTQVTRVFRLAPVLLCLSFGCTKKPGSEIVESPIIEDLTTEPPTLPPVDQGPLDSRPGDATELPPLAFTAQVDTAAPQLVSLSVLDGVQVSIKLSGAFAGSDVSVEFIAPEQTVYQRKETKLQGSVFDEQQLTFNLPVAGTLIDSGKLAGTWAARFELDGIELTTQTFELAP
jgi:hypothetical protein